MEPIPLSTIHSPPSTLFVIHWRNLTTGRTGIGPAKFDAARARELQDELNAEYPEFEHQALPAGTEAKWDI